MTRLTRFTSTLAGDATDTSGPDARDTLNDILTLNRGTNVGMQRPLGMGSTFTAGGGNNTTGMTVGKETVDAPFTAVRLHVFSKEPINESSGWEVIVAPTDQVLNDSTANAFIPQVGGTQYNVLADAAADKSQLAMQYGWRRPQWGGGYTDGRASKSGVLRPGSMERTQSNLLTSGGFYTATPGIITSDWCEIKSAPAAADGRYYMLFRVKRAAVPGETAAFAAYGDGNPAYKAAKDLSWYRRRFVTGGSGDGITNLTDMPAAPTEANFEWGPCPWAFEYRFDRPVRTVAACGDSLTEGGGYQAYGYNNWLVQAVGTISTADKPVLAINLGFSTVRFSVFIGQLEQLFAAGVRYTDVILPNVSFNDLNTFGSGAVGRDYLLGQVQSRLMRAVEMCRRHGARVYVMTDPHQDGGNATPSDLFGVAMYNFTLKLGASGLVKVIDVRKEWVRSTMLGADATHATQIGIDLQARLTADALTL